MASHVRRTGYLCGPELLPFKVFNFIYDLVFEPRAIAYTAAKFAMYVYLQFRKNNCGSHRNNLLSTIYNFTTTFLQLFIKIIMETCNYNVSAFMEAKEI